MKTRASILRSAPGQYEPVELDLEGPRQNEVMIKLAASGLCHSDDHMATGDITLGHYPHCGGHEGSGVVVEVGPNTKGWEVGDHLIAVYLPACGRCRWCAAGMQNLCDLGSTTLRGSRPDDPTSFRLFLDGQPVAQAAGVSTFSEYSTISVSSAVKVPKEIPLVPLSLIGCGVSTGWGTAVNAAQVRPGQTVVVMGAGGVGTGAIQGAKHAGATNIIAVDISDFKRKSALDFGATHGVATLDEAVEIASDYTNGQGPHSIMITVGVIQASQVEAAVRAVSKAGTVVVTAAGRQGDHNIPIDLLMFTMMQRRLQGAIFGMNSPLTTIPLLTQMYVAGQLKLDEMITKKYTVDQVAEAYEDMHAGTIVRGVVEYAQ